MLERNAQTDYQPNVTQDQTRHYNLSELAKRTKDNKSGLFLTRNVPSTSSFKMENNKKKLPTRQGSEADFIED